MIERALYVKTSSLLWNRQGTQQKNAYAQFSLTMEENDKVKVEYAKAAQDGERSYNWRKPQALTWTKEC